MFVHNAIYHCTQKQYFSIAEAPKFIRFQLNTAIYSFSYTDLCLENTIYA